MTRRQLQPLLKQAGRLRGVEAEAERLHEQDTGWELSGRSVMERVWLLLEAPVTTG
ncbi:hypothetical protein [Streptomyces sp. NPDC086787]|uniref:hypothetical protein n=1 Tax=Streptomyces sp. NPDC086787 TaxID=3365759 RepID=UPI0037F7211D